ncbi:MAG: hypothetical protein LBH90_03390 [Tannerella sp.]|nr:hypothetical protein [Tannerella sp.]
MNELIQKWTFWDNFSSENDSSVLVLRTRMKWCSKIPALLSGYFPTTDRNQNEVSRPRQVHETGEENRRIFCPKRGGHFPCTGFESRKPV